MNEDIKQWTVEELVPHSGHMVLLDTVTECTDHSIKAELTIKENELFLDDNGVPAWVGIEYMAQAIGAFAGVQAKRAGEEIKVGLLIGTRKYQADMPAFKVGSHLRISAEEIHKEENGLSVFASKIETDQGSVKANLNVFVPKDIDAYMSGDQNV